MEKLFVLIVLMLVLVSCHGVDKTIEKTNDNQVTENTTKLTDKISIEQYGELSDNEIIQFRDQALEHYIRQYYNLPKGDIRLKDIKYRETLEIGARFNSDTYRMVEELPIKERISSLEDLKYFRNLKSLFLYKNSISTPIDDIATLYKLEELYIVRVPISGDIKKLASLKNLKTLILGYTEIEGNINKLAKLDKLESISFNWNVGLGGDIQGLNSLKKLKNFYVASGKTLFGELSEFEKLDALETLIISNCEHLKGDISKILELPNLQEFDLNKIDNISIDINNIKNKSIQYKFKNGMIEISEGIYNAKDIYVSYPVIIGLENKEIEQKVNDIIKDTIIFKELTGENPNLAFDKEHNIKYYADLKSGISFINQDMLAVHFYGYWGSSMAPHPWKMSLGCLIDLHTGKQIALNDIVDIKELVENYQYVIHNIDDSDLGDMIKEQYEYIKNNDTEQDLLQYFTDDYEWESNINDDFYITKDGLVVIKYVPHVIGGYSEVMIPFDRFQKLNSKFQDLKSQKVEIIVNRIAK